MNYTMELTFAIGPATEFASRLFGPNISQSIPTMVLDEYLAL